MEGCGSNTCSLCMEMPKLDVLDNEGLSLKGPWNVYNGYVTICTSPLTNMKVISSFFYDIEFISNTIFQKDEVKK